MNTDVALNKLKDICSRQEKSPSDIITLLKKWDIPAEEHEKLISILKTEKFMDEYRYASAFTRDKIKFDHWGFVKIRIMLHHKGIARDIVEEVFHQVDRDEYRSMISHELNKKRRTLKGSPYEKWAKLARYGSSKGFELRDMQEFLGDQGETG
jgi:regulatory protein